MLGLYAIVDAEILERRGASVVAFAEAVLDARPAALQLRDKRQSSRATLELLRAIAPLAARAGVPLFANDRPDLAVLAGCHGVHLGQDDVPPSVALAAARAVGTRALAVGLSTHDERQLERAQSEGALAYIAVGPVFATTSKERPSPILGLDRLASLVGRARALRPGRPIVAIGGIGLANAREVGARCACAAAIGALVPDAGGVRVLDEVRDRARALHAAIIEGAERAAATRAAERSEDNDAAASCGRDR